MGPPNAPVVLANDELDEVQTDRVVRTAWRARIAARRRERGLLERHRVVGLLGSVFLLALVVGASITVGSKTIALGDSWNALVAFDGSQDHVIVRSLRVPRTLVGLFAGACLGLGAAVMQGFTRNPLADPGLLGVNAGSSLAIVVGLTFWSMDSVSEYIWLAFGGALVASAVVYVLGSGGPGGASPVKMTLAGTALSALFGSFTAAILLFDKSTLDRFRFWAVGSLNGRDGDVVVQIAPFAVAAIALGLLCARPLNILALGDDVATALGSHVARYRLVAALAVVACAGTATAAAGPITFVGLLIPHLARRMVGPDYRWILAYSALLAPVLLLSSDVIGRVIARPAEVAVGIVTAIVGAPIFVLMARNAKLRNL